MSMGQKQDELKYGLSIFGNQYQQQQISQCTHNSVEKKSDENIQNENIVEQNIQQQSEDFIEQRQEVEEKVEKQVQSQQPEEGQNVAMPIKKSLSYKKKISIEQVIEQEDIQQTNKKINQRSSVLSNDKTKQVNEMKQIEQETQEEFQSKLKQREQDTDQDSQQNQEQYSQQQQKQNYKNLKKKEKQQKNTSNSIESTYRDSPKPLIYKRVQEQNDESFKTKVNTQNSQGTIQDNRHAFELTEEYFIEEIRFLKNDRPFSPTEIFFPKQDEYSFNNNSQSNSQRAINQKSKTKTRKQKPQYNNQLDNNPFDKNIK